MLNKSKKWIVAVSGGPDSMVLLDMLRLQGHTLICAHVDYQKRASSARDRKIVEAYTAQYAIPLEVRYYSEVTSEGNFQAQARQFRYDFFYQLYQKHACDGVAVAHHFDDHVETYMFQKERKMMSDVVGLSAWSHYETMPVYRPLLTMTKKEILDYCKKHKLHYGVDESNASLLYTRNRIRHALQTMPPLEYDTLLLAMQQDMKRWKASEQALERTLSTWRQGVSIETFQKQEHKERLLRKWLKIVGVDVSRFRFDYLSEMVKVIETGKAWFEFGDIVLSASYGSVYVEILVPYSYTFETLHYGDFGQFRLASQGTLMEGVALEASDFPITIRNAQADDAIKLRYGTKKLNRFFIDRKIPLHERKMWPVIENSAKHVVFVVGIGCDVQHYANKSNLFVIK